MQLDHSNTKRYLGHDCASLRTFRHQPNIWSSKIQRTELLAFVWKLPFTMQ